MREWCDCRVTVNRGSVSFFESFLSHYPSAGYSVFQKPGAKNCEYRIFIPLKKSRLFLEEIQRAADVLSLLSPYRERPKVRIRVWSDSGYREEWKAFFPVLSIGRFLIRPNWKRVKAQKGRTVIEIEPGMAFGTGHHFTTAYCIRSIQRSCRGKSDFLDAGCGSGILSIAASLCGISHITGIDISSDAVRSSRENFRKNCPDKDASFQKISLKNFSSRRKFDVIVANLFDSVIVKNALLIQSLIKKEGILILSGIRYAHKESVKSAFRRLELVHEAPDKKKEWYGLTYRKNVPHDI